MESSIGQLCCKRLLNTECSGGGSIRPWAGKIGDDFDFFPRL
jgi:hypothetical protein